MRWRLRGGRDRVYQALLAHPLVGRTDLAETLSLEMVRGNRSFLPWA